MEMNMENNHQQWPSEEAESKFREGVKHILSNWPFLKNSMNDFLLQKIHGLVLNITLFFSGTEEPDVDAVATMLRNAIYDLMPYDDCKKAAEKILAIHKSCVLERQMEIENGLWPEPKLGEALKPFLWEWLNLRETMDNEISGFKISLLAQHIFNFFSRTAQPDVDALAEEMNYRFFLVLGVVELRVSRFRKEAEQLFVLHRDCVEGNFRYNKTLRQARNPTLLVVQKRGQKVLKKRQR